MLSLTSTGLIPLSRKSIQQLCYEKQFGLTLTFVRVNLLYPGEGVDFHQGVRDAYHMHPIHDTLPQKQTSIR